ncbi:MAG TPA: PBP1A family penicillin-binding protein [Papillibacter sp.]|nr:PBP1A family penicillin-binding protein [Papillibacter sp.]
MSQKRRRTAGQITYAGVRTVGGILALIIKVIGTLILIGITTALIFTCIFLVYVKTNLTSELGISLDNFTMNESSIIYYLDRSDGEYKELVTLQSGEYRIWVDYEQIPKSVEHALVAIEDKRFYKHQGVDWYRTFGAFVNMFLSMKNNFGGSTITQQLIKNITEDDEITVQRKLTEIFRALDFERRYDKKEIVEWYLNVVYFGHGCYGIGAASNYYFGKDVSALTLAEAASIIAITNNPSMYSPYTNREANKRRQTDILNEMRNQGYIDTAEMEEAKSQTLRFQRGSDNSTIRTVYTWFEDALIEDLIEFLMEEKNISYRMAETVLFTNGYHIYATIDPAIQEMVDSIYENLEEIPKVTGSNQQVQSAMVIAEPYTGEIVALAGGVGEKTQSRILRRATQSRRPPGSSLKPIAVYAPAIELRQITPETRFLDAEDVRLTGTDWMPKNDDLRYNGVVDVRYAVRRSLNTIAAQVVDKITPQASYDFITQKLGIPLPPDDNNYAPMALGQLTHGMTVRDLTQAFTIFPNSGIQTKLRMFTHITDADGKVLYENNRKNVVAISDVTAYWVTDLLRDAVNSGTGTSARLSNMPVAGKTGTSTDFKDRWFAGFTPYYVAVVWTGYDTPAKMSSSGNPSAQLWKKVMEKVHTDLPYKDFPKPANVELEPIPGVEAEYPYVVRGMTVDGTLLYEETKKAQRGTIVTEQAQEVEGYRLAGSADKAITITGDPLNDVIEFFYQIKVDPVPPDEEDPTTTPIPPDDEEDEDEDDGDDSIPAIPPWETPSPATSSTPRNPLVYNW